MASIATFGRPPFVCRTCSQALRLRVASRSTDPPRRTLRTPHIASTSYTSVASTPPLSHPLKHEPRQTRQPLEAWRWPRRTSTTIAPHGYRSFSTQALSNSSLDQSRGIAPLTHRRLVSLSGPDACKYLQGLVTNNIEPQREHPYYSAFLDARGRVLWDVFIWPGMEAGERTYYIEVDGDELNTLLKHLKKHKLRSKIVMRVVEPDDLDVLAAWGHGIQAELPAANTTVIEDPRALKFGYRILRDKKQPGADFPTASLATSQQYRLRRYQFGIPEGQKEIIRESALPLEYNIDLSQGIHFGKGCYVGQELTIRTKHTGVVRKRVLPVQLYRAEDPIPIDHAPVSFDPSWAEQASFSTDIKQLDEKGCVKTGRAAGKLISSIGNVGLAICRLEMMTPMRVSAEGGSFKPGVEFAVQVSKEEGREDAVSVLRVKPVVPSWLREREEELWGKARNKSMVQE